MLNIFTITVSQGFTAFITSEFMLVCNGYIFRLISKSVSVQFIIHAIRLLPRLLYHVMLAYISSVLYQFVCAYSIELEAEGCLYINETA